MSAVDPYLVDRFMRKLEYAPTSDCWLWTAGTTVRGYGQISKSINGTQRKLLVHRLSYEHFRGPIADGLVIDHLCRVPACANPAHLEAVTQRENIIRGVSLVAANNRKISCNRGHPLSGENLRISVNGDRRCRICAAKQNATYHAENWGEISDRKRRYRASLSEEMKERIRARDRARNRERRMKPSAEV